AGLVLGGEFPNRPRRDDRRHRTAIFIREQVQPASGLPGAAHLFVEAAIAGWRRAAVERDADDGVLRVFQDDLFGGNFGFGVNAQRVGLRGLVVVAFTTVKDQIAGKENKWTVGGQFS